MAALSTIWPTLRDVASRENPDGGIADIAELLNLSNIILDDMPFLEGNLPTGHRSTVRTGLPTPTWRKLYGGVQPAKSRTAQVTDSCGMLEAYAEVDKALADLNGNTAAFRLSEDKAHIESMAQEQASTLFYGNETTEPEAFTGLAPRFNSLSAQNADNIVNAAGSGNTNTSVWLIGWGDDSVFGIYPKGSKSGLQRVDKGQVTIEDVTGSSGGRMEAYRTHYRWDCGLVVKDWRYISAVRNIKVGDLDTLANTKNLITWMIQASERIPSFGGGRRFAWYCNRFVREKLRLGIVEKISSNLTWESVSGQRIMTFDGIPVHRCDAILKTEADIS